MTRDGEEREEQTPEGAVLASASEELAQVQERIGPTFAGRRRAAEQAATCARCSLQWSAKLAGNWPRN